MLTITEYSGFDIYSQCVYFLAPYFIESSSRVRCNWRTGQSPEGEVCSVHSHHLGEKVQKMKKISTITHKTLQEILERKVRPLENFY